MVLKMTKNKKKTKKSAAKTKKPIDINDAISALGFLGSGKTMFSGMNMNLGIGDKAFVTGKAVNLKGHAPASKFATLSDGSKLTLSGANKGLIVKK